MASRPDSRDSRYRRGLRAEVLAAWLLRLKGYRILARRFKTPVGEIDILARRGSTIIAVEVKYRRDLSDALSSISDRQWQRTRRALEWWQACHADGAEPDFRFDAVILCKGRLPRHIPDAWRP